MISESRVAEVERLIRLGHSDRTISWKLRLSRPIVADIRTGRWTERKIKRSQWLKDREFKIDQENDEKSPTPEEIAERAAEIRSRWGPEEETIRRTGPVP